MALLCVVCSSSLPSSAPAPDSPSLIFLMCVQKEPYNWSRELYDRYTHVILDYCLQNMRPQLREAMQQMNDTLLMRIWVDCWRQHRLIVKGLSRLFMYLDRFFSPNNSETVLPLAARAHTIFHNVIFSECAEHITKAVLRCVRLERQGAEQDRTLLHAATQVFVQLGSHLCRSMAGDGKNTFLSAANPVQHRLDLYRKIVEIPMVQETSQWYEINSQKWLEQDSCPTYLEKVERHIQSGQFQR